VAAPGPSRELWLAAVLWGLEGAQRAGPDWTRARTFKFSANLKAIELEDAARDFMVEAIDDR
jgi:hypothetical protein